MHLSIDLQIAWNQSNATQSKQQGQVRCIELQLHPRFASPCHLHGARLLGVKGLRSWDRMGRIEFAMGKAEQKVWVHLLQLVCNPSGNEESCNVQHWCCSKLPSDGQVLFHLQRNICRSTKGTASQEQSNQKPVLLGYAWAQVLQKELKPTPYLILKKDKGTVYKQWSYLVCFLNKEESQGTPSHQITEMLFLKGWAIRLGGDQ